MWDHIALLHERTHRQTVETHLLNLTQQVGRATDTYLMATDLTVDGSSRTTREDLLARLAEVIITTAVTMNAITSGDTTQADHHLQTRLQVAIDQLNTSQQPRSR